MLLHAAALSLPVTRFVLSVEPISAVASLRSAAVALTVLVVVEVHKAWGRRRDRGPVSG